MYNIERDYKVIFINLTILIIQGVSKIPERLDNKVVTGGHMWSKEVKTG